MRIVSRHEFRGGGIELPPFSLRSRFGAPCGDRALAAKPASPVGPCLRQKFQTICLLVFIGGGPGASLRHTVNTACTRALKTAFPYHTSFINVTGSTVMGLFAGLALVRHFA